jgi:hypothetical protein
MWNREIVVIANSLVLANIFLIISHVHGNRYSTFRGFLVFVVHVFGRLTHGVNYLEKVLLLAKV